MNPSFILLGLIGLGAHLGVALIQLGFLGTLVLFVARQDRPPLDRPLLWLVLSFGVFALAHSLFGQQPMAEPDYLLRWRYLLLLPMVPALLTAQDAQKLLAGLLVLTGLSGIYGIVQVIAESPGWLGFLHPDGTVRPIWRYVWDVDHQQWIRDGLKATGAIHNIAAFAHVTMVVLLWPLACGLLGTKRVPPWQVLAGLMGLAGLSLSGARAAWLGFSVGLLILVVARWHGTWLRAVSLSATLVIGGLGLGLLGSAELRQASGSLTGRGQIWDHCLKTSQETLPRGLGYGTHANYADAIYPQTTALEKKVRTWCHHVPLSLAVEAPVTLVPALFLLVFLILALTRSTPTPRQGLALATVLAFWTIAQLHDPHFQREFFPLAMLVMGCGLIPKESSNDADGS